MQYFIDLGCFKGAMISKAIRLYPKCAKYIGFEPVPKFYNALVRKFSNNPKIEIKSHAASNVAGVSELYVSRAKNKITRGSTLLQGKITGNVSNKDHISVTTIDFSEYLKLTFAPNDNIILKMNIEGSEYIILEHLIQTGAIGLVSTLFCEWHVSKIQSISQARHDALIKSLSHNGLDLTGVGHLDGFKGVKI